MSRGQHRQWTVRNTRLAATKIATRKANAPAKHKAASRRDAYVKARIKALLGKGVGLPAYAQSWLSRQIGKPFTKINAAEIDKAVA